MNTIKAIALLFLIWQPQWAAAAEATRAFALENIRHINLRGAAEMMLTQGETEALTITADEKTLQNVEIHQKDGTLYLNVRSRNWSWFNWGEDDDVRFAVSLRQLESLTLTGAAQVTGGDWFGEKLSIDITGASQLQVGRLAVKQLAINLTGASHSNIEQLRGEELQVELTGASHMAIKQSGEVARQQVNLTGASHYKATPLKSRSASIQVTGASSAEVYATEALEISAHGASNVRYYGTSQARTQTSGFSNTDYRGADPAGK